MAAAGWTAPGLAAVRWLAPALARTLPELGCDIGQGTGIAAPMRSDQVAGWVRDDRGMLALAPMPGLPASAESTDRAAPRRP